MGWNYDKKKTKQVPSEPGQGRDETMTEGPNWIPTVACARPPPRDPFSRRDYSENDDQLSQITPICIMIKFQFISNTQMVSDSLLEIRYNITPGHRHSPEVCGILS